MPYLDKDEKFYDYRTRDVDGTDIFDTRKASNSDAQQILDGSEYWRTEKNTYSEIVQMSPMEYFEACARDCFDEPVEKLIQSRRHDVNILEHLKQVIQVYKKRFPIPYIDYARYNHPEQEGLHRMMVAGDLFGWHTKFPVQIIKWVDEQRAAEAKALKHRREIERYLDIAVHRALRYKYYNIAELKDQLHSEFESEVRYVDEFENREYTFELENADNQNFIVKVDDKYSFMFPVDAVQFTDPIKDDLEDIDDLDDWLTNYLNEATELSSDWDVDKINQDLAAQFGKSFSEESICHKVAEYIANHYNAELLSDEFVYLIDISAGDIIPISNKHSIVRKANKIYDFTANQFKDYPCNIEVKIPRILVQDKDLSEIFSRPTYRDNNYIITIRD